MRRRVLLIVLLAVVLPSSAGAQISVPFTFVSGTVADPDQVNTNFSTIASQALDRTGGTLTGNLIADPGVTMDGVDVGAILGGTGTPTFSSVTTGTLTVSGASTLASLSVTGFGVQTFSASGTGGNRIRIEQTSNGTTDYAGLELGNDMAPDRSALQMLSSGFTPSTYRLADGLAVASGGVGGISLAATHAAGALRFYSGGTTERLRLHASGGLSYGNTSDPGASTVSVTGSVTVSSGLTVTGTATLGAASVSGTSTLGAVTVGSTLSVTGASTLGSVSIGGALTVGGSAPMTFPVSTTTLLVCDNVTENSLSSGSFKVVRLTTGGGSVCLVNGMTAGTDGLMMLLVNATGQQISLLHEDVSVTASARFSLPGGTNANFFANEVLWVWYDVTSLRWRTAARP